VFAPASKRSLGENAGELGRGPRSHLLAPRGEGDLEQSVCLARVSFSERDKTPRHCDSSQHVRIAARRSFG
jgi:hypothetical protein